MAIRINMEKARTIHMDVIRGVRDTELDRLDVTYMRAMEAGDTEGQTKIKTAKQILRDIPQTFDLAARTPAQLKQLWPQELPVR